MILTLANEKEVQSKKFDGVSYKIKVLTPIDVESVVQKEKTTTNTELVEKYCISLSGVQMDKKSITSGKELVNCGGALALVEEIATEILHCAFLSEDEKNE